MHSTNLTNSDNNVAYVEMFMEQMKYILKCEVYHLKNIYILFLSKTNSKTKTNHQNKFLVCAKTYLAINLFLILNTLFEHVVHVSRYPITNIFVSLKSRHHLTLF